MSGPGEIWLATANTKKRLELERILAPLGIAIRTRAITVAEDAPDFAGNARQKATALALQVGAPALGDDSGLCVDALHGAPGVHSARYAGPGKTDQERNAKLLRELAQVPATQRGARFVCSICLADAAGNVLAAFEETCEGTLLMAARGDHGFGYDPLFVPREIPDKTFAELSPDEKDRVSHRGKALRRLVSYLRDRRQ